MKHYKLVKSLGKRFDHVAHVGSIATAQGVELRPGWLKIDVHILPTPDNPGSYRFLMSETDFRKYFQEVIEDAET